MRQISMVCLVIATCALAFGCSDENEADELGVGAECTSTDDCNEDQQCLTNFKGGYCGLTDCGSSDDCPEGARCVAHTDGQNYCFRACVDKEECNSNRDVENESNCSSNITFASGDKEGKACVPPSN